MLADCNDARIQDLISNGLSKLNYVPVHIQGIDHVQYALNDSGSEMNLIRRNLVQQLNPLPSRSRIKLKVLLDPLLKRI